MRSTFCNTASFFLKDIYIHTFFVFNFIFKTLDLKRGLIDSINGIKRVVSITEIVLHSKNVNLRIYHVTQHRHNI